MYVPNHRSIKQPGKVERQQEIQVSEVLGAEREGVA